MLEDGFIKPNNNIFSSPVLLIKKKDGTWNFCVDYKVLTIIRDRFSMSTINELVDELGSTTIFTKIDLYSGYHQIRVIPINTHKTVFHTTNGNYEFLVIPFSLTNAPSTFQATMNDFFNPI